MTPVRSTIIILSGPPGAGKTTIAPLVADHFEKSVHLQMDAFFEFIRGGFVEPYLAEARSQNEVVMDILASAAIKYASAGYTVVIDGVVEPWYLHVFSKAADAAGIEIHYIVLRPKERVVLPRATGRRSPELIDAGPVSNMYARFVDLSPYDHHVVDSSSLDPNATAALLLSGLLKGGYSLHSRS